MGWLARPPYGEKAALRFFGLKTDSRASFQRLQVIASLEKMQAGDLFDGFERLEMPPAHLAFQSASILLQISPFSIVIKEEVL